MLSAHTIDDDTSDDRPLDKATVAAEAASVFIQASSAKSEDIKRPRGLILTMEQIVSLKKYELAGLALPTELSDVIIYLGYERGAGAGLEPENFQESFKIIHAHAARWNPLRTNLMAVGSTLEVFAGQMLIYGNSMDELYTEIREGQLTEKHGSIKTWEDLQKLEIELGDKFPDVELNDEDKEKTTKEIKEYLDQILTKVEQCQLDAQNIKKDLDTFGRDLSVYVVPEIKRKLVAIDNNSLSDDIKKLATGIEKRAAEIDIKNNEYQTAVKDSLASLAKLNTVGLAMSIYFGVEAEGVRHARNQLMAEQSNAISEMELKNKILGRLSRVRFELQNLFTVTIEADIATQNLSTVWRSLSDFITHSQLSSAEINDTLSLRMFMTHFRQVVLPWKTIEEDSGALLDVFKEADEEFKRIYGEEQ